LFVVLNFSENERQTLENLSRRLYILTLYVEEHETNFLLFIFEDLGVKRGYNSSRFINCGTWIKSKPLE
jgi:hypothetical protein